MITRISHVTVFVRDQKTAYEVYVDKLGFTVTNDLTMDNGLRWLTVTPPGQPNVQLVLAEARPPMIGESLVPHYRALLDADAMGAGVWECDDCQKTYDALRARGIEFTKAPKKEFYGIEALFKDGCGNWFSLTQHV